MKYLFLAILCTACTSAQISQTLNEVNKAMGTPPSTTPTTEEVGGGLKEALINGMIERLIAEFDALVEAQRQDTYTKAYMEATIAAIRGGRLRRWAVVTGATGDPRLLAPIRQAMVRWHTEGLDAERAGWRQGHAGSAGPGCER